MDNQKEKLAFDKTNYVLLLAGIAVLVLGFILMSLDSELHGFGFLGLTLGPIVVMIGFIIELFAILYRSRK
jgi:fumarate reductase subunit C